MRVCLVVAALQAWQERAAVRTYTGFLALCERDSGYALLLLCLLCTCRSKDGCPMLALGFAAVSHSSKAVKHNIGR